MYFNLFKPNQTKNVMGNIMPGSTLQLHRLQFSTRQSCDNFRKLNQSWLIKQKKVWTFCKTKIKFCFKYKQHWKSYIVFSCKYLSALVLQILFTIDVGHKLFLDLIMISCINPISYTTDFFLINLQMLRLTMK